MYKFEFSTKKILNINTSSYPVTLADIKKVSQFYKQNPDDTSQDSYVEDTLIPASVENWEEQTRFLLLDQQIKASIPSIGTILSEKIQLYNTFLNVRNTLTFSYYPRRWDHITPKTEIDPADYYINPESLGTSQVYKLFHRPWVPIQLYTVDNNLEIIFNAGYADNDFSTLPKEIKDALAMQVASQIDVLQGYCIDLYSKIIAMYYDKFALIQPLASII